MRLKELRISKGLNQQECAKTDTKLETNQMFISWWRYLQKVIYPYYGILLSINKELSFDGIQQYGKTQKYFINWKNKDKKDHMLHDSN